MTCMFGPNCPDCLKIEIKREDMAIINQNKKPSTTLDIQLVCGCILRERFEFYKSKTPRNFKTLLRRVYDREDDQSINIKGKTFVNLVASPNCEKHWVEPKSAGFPRPSIPPTINSKYNDSYIELEDTPAPIDSQVKRVEILDAFKLLQKQIMSLYEQVGNLRRNI